VKEAHVARPGAIVLLHGDEMMGTSTVNDSRRGVKTADYRDLVIPDLADDNAALREANRQLIDLVADLAYENSILRILLEREQFSRVHGDVTIARLYRILNLRQAA
jgi:hypothetical protein